MQDQTLNDLCLHSELFSPNVMQRSGSRELRYFNLLQISNFSDERQDAIQTHGLFFTLS